jgi:hypothetical protein
MPEYVNRSVDVERKRKQRFLFPVETPELTEKQELDTRRKLVENLKSVKSKSKL